MLPIRTSTSTHLSSDARFVRRGRGAVLVVVDGPDAGSHVAVDDGEIIVGTGPSSALRLTDATVSRDHVSVSWDGRRARVRDLSSKNGTFVGDTLVRDADISLGDRFRVGSTTLALGPEEQRIDPEAFANDQLGALYGTSEVMRQLFTLIEQVAASDVTVLIEGETGVGKELVAAEIHRLSKRGQRPLVTFDCGAVPTELLESALFGHLRGSFTGAVADKQGAFEAANTSTVFLDEIGELRVDLQPSLLRVLDQRKIRRVGDVGYRDIDVRVVAATHRDLDTMILEERFREDLYYRLAVVRIRVPPLRDRPEDIEGLVQRFLGAEGWSGPTPDDDQLDELCAYDWPGNIRQLRNVVARAVALSDGSRLELELAPGPKRTRGSQPLEEFRVAKASAVETFEHGYLSQLMEGHTSITAAANAAGMDRKHLRTLLRRHGLI